MTGWVLRWLWSGFGFRLGLGRLDEWDGEFAGLEGIPFEPTNADEKGDGDDGEKKPSAAAARRVVVEKIGGLVGFGGVGESEERWAADGG